MEQIRKEFEGKVPRNLFNIGYRISLLAVAFLMLLLPVLYLSVIAGAGIGLYYYFTEVMPGLMETLPRGRGAVFAMMIYVTPIVGGLIMIVFMIKPVFFTLVPERAQRKRSLTKASEPDLFELVDHICGVTRSPKPKRIDIDYDVNASASLRNGFWSLFRQDLVLTIGAPLIAGMNLRQLTGVLAHEFGHFAQGGGMKSVYVIRMINSWFARVVYQRDQLDEQLDSAIENGDWRISMILLVGKLFVYLSRMILWLFMMIAHAVSCIMMQQMEYDADRYEAFVSGSDYFAETHKRILQLSLGQQGTIKAVIEGLESRHLLGDLPKLTSSFAEQVSARDLQKMDKANEESTGLLSTHPSHTSRIKAAKKLNAPGMFHIERPAREVFRNFEGLCQGASVDFYRNEFGVLVKPEQLVSWDDE
ncbi:M48 family metalloprotease [Stieleria varia]|nr:M48 family metallopeptidase [Stieleria varia]